MCFFNNFYRAIIINISKQETSLVTVSSRKLYVYKYEGKLNGMVNAVVLISYPENAFHDPKALRTFVCTDVSLTTMKILDAYVERWPIELFFRQSKKNLPLINTRYVHHRESTDTGCSYHLCICFVAQRQVSSAHLRTVMPIFNGKFKGNVSCISINVVKGISL